jgi:lipoyl(octanoyl) transferase
MTATAATECLRIEHLGRVSYGEAWQLQLKLHAEVVAGRSPPTLLLLEHPRTITLGRSGDRSHLLHTDSQYAELGIDIHNVERGGLATYHGPGQLVGYAIVPVASRVGDFLRMIEGTLLDVLDGYGITARGSPGYAGVWAGRPEAKVAAVGIAVRQRVAFHGFALNANPDLADFDLIVPCGIRDRGVTSIERLLGTAPPMDDVAGRVADSFSRHYARLSGASAA